jgi:hypothetical protein
MNCEAGRDAGKIVSIPLCFFCAFCAFSRLFCLEQNSDEQELIPTGCVVILQIRHGYFACYLIDELINQTV